MPATFDQSIQTAARLIKNAQTMVALTGAGISTPSGIPDFRSPGSGLWNQVSPMEVASIIAFRQHPQEFYNWVKPLAQKIINAHPNSAHQALAHLESAAYLKAIITQNIDGLHQAAGSQVVYEVHGHIREMTCTRCYTVKDSAPMIRAMLNQQPLPQCACGGSFKPNVILFGEQLPVQTLFKAKITVQEADLLLVAGSSLEVAPIADLPHEAVTRGTKLIIINYQETYMDSRADVVIHDDVTRVLPQIADLVCNG